MKVKVELVYGDKTTKNVELTLKGEPKGLRLMNAVEKAVEKLGDEKWERWNLLDVIS